MIISTMQESTARAEDFFAGLRAIGAQRLEAEDGMEHPSDVIVGPRDLRRCLTRQSARDYKLQRRGYGHVATREQVFLLLRAFNGFENEEERSTELSASTKYPEVFNATFAPTH
jgi:hypothetical protein